MYVAHTHVYFCKLVTKCVVSKTAELTVYVTWRERLTD